MATPNRRLSRTSKLLLGQFPSHASGKLIPRGIAIPIDIFLDGESRFVRKIGPFFPLLSPQNTMRLSSDVAQRATLLAVESLLPSIPVGSLISLRGRETKFVADVLAATNTLRILDDTGVLAEYPAGTPVYLHAVPITMDLSALAGATVVTVSSDFLIVDGDTLVEVVDPEISGSGIEHNVLDVTILQEDTKPFTYTLTLDSALAVDHLIGTSLYLRAFPAYKSKPLPLPTQPTILGENIGPFLWDFMEGRMHDGLDHPQVVLAVGTLSSAFDELEAISQVTKNTPHYRAEIPSSVFSFWSVHMGSMSIEGRYTLGEPDEEGDFLISTPVVPNLPVSFMWRGTFQATADFALRIGFHLAEPQESPPVLPAGYTYVESSRMVYLDVVIPGGDVIWPVLIQSPPVESDRLQIGGFSETSDNRVVLRDWSPDRGYSSWVTYTLMARVNGDYTWAASGLIIKPMFLTRDSLRIGERLDSGLVMF